MVGELGEDLACEYLVRKGYKILARNYREKLGEIDIVARAKDRTLVFVEVKTFKSASGTDAEGDELMPEDNLTKGKLGRLKKACQSFLAKNEALLYEKRGWRIDLLAIEIGRGPVDVKNPANKIRHYENI